MYFAIHKSSDGQFYWRAVGNNHETLAVSEMLTRKETCEHAIAVVKAEAASAQIVDVTKPT